MCIALLGNGRNDSSFLQNDPKLKFQSSKFHLKLKYSVIWNASSEAQHYTK